MNTKSFLVAFYLISGVFLLVPTRTYGQVSGTEQLGFTLVAGEPFVNFYPNIFDPTHPKELWLTGFANNFQTTPNLLEVTFDWINQQGQIELSPVFQIPLVPGPEPTPLDVHHQIPFCPQQVSLHLALETGSAGIEAQFRHECIVPEPCAASLAAVASLGALALIRRRTTNSTRFRAWAR
jgi:hypothetical protein